MFIDIRQVLSSSKKMFKNIMFLFLFIYFLNQGQYIVSCISYEIGTWYKNVLAFSY